VNEIGESVLSQSNSVIFANIPSAPSSLTLTPTAYPASIKAEWTAPQFTNGDSVTGYRVYVDDGFGGAYELVFHSNSSSTYAYEIPGLTCGLLYSVQVTAKNSAGEGSSITQNVWLGQVPSEPLNPTLISIEPDVDLVLGWDVPLTDGCLPILSYTVAKDGSDHILDISPTLKSISDDISVSGSIGETITYKIKAIN
jgi:hypothetical protein